jgi:Undecaprenyl-phosphate glucose phosphotransferase
MDNVIPESPPGEATSGSNVLVTQNDRAVFYTDDTSDSDRHPIQRPNYKPPAEFISVTVAALDGLLIVVTAAVVFASYFTLPDRSAVQPSVYLATAWISAIIYVAFFERLNGYSLKRLQALEWQISHIAMVWAITMAVLLLTGFLGRVSEFYSRGWALLWFFAAPASLTAIRGIEYAALIRWLDGGAFARTVVIVGAGEDGQRLVKLLLKYYDRSFILRGIFDDRQSRRPLSVHGIPVRGSIDDLLALARRERIDEVVVALPLVAADRLKGIFEKLTALPCDLRLSVNVIAEQLPICGVDYLSKAPLLEIIDHPMKHGRGVCKWLEDKLLASLLFVFLGPLMALISGLIKLDSRGPVLFIQQRFGYNNNVIRVFKFRTMYVDKCDHSGAQRTVQYDPRITRIGRILRTLSLDELPQLINVLRGDMSLVGPRPHAVAMKAGDRLYHHAVVSYPRRHRVKPGITGWAQVNGFRGEVDTLEKAQARVEYDLEYIAQWSLWLDLKILLMTVGILVARTGAY